MVDVGRKPDTRAGGRGLGRGPPGACGLQAHQENQLKKGDALAVAQQQASRQPAEASQRSPLCHHVNAEPRPGAAGAGPRLRAAVIRRHPARPGYRGGDGGPDLRCHGCPRLYDMSQGRQQGHRIGPEIKLVNKTGGQRGDFPPSVGLLPRSHPRRQRSSSGMWFQPKGKGVKFFSPVTFSR